jgi:hypothetical protein
VALQNKSGWTFPQLHPLSHRTPQRSNHVQLRKEWHHESMFEKGISQCFKPSELICL